MIIADNAGRYVIATGTLCQTHISMIGIYAPNRSQHSFWRKIFSQVSSGQEILLLGDFNADLDTKLDRSKPSGTPEISPVFKGGMIHLGLKDVWRKQHDQILDFTYYSACH